MKKKKAVPFLLPVVLLLSFFGPASAQRSLINLNSDQMTAVEGKPVELNFQSKVLIDSCKFVFPGYKTIKAYKDVKTKDYEFVGNYEKGECGIRFSAMKQELEGPFTVEVTFPNEDDPADATGNLVMVNPPENEDVNNGSVYFIAGGVLLLLALAGLIYFLKRKGKAVHILYRHVVSACFSGPDAHDAERGVPKETHPLVDMLAGCTTDGPLKKVAVGADSAKPQNGDPSGAESGNETDQSSDDDEKCSSQPESIPKQKKVVNFNKKCNHQ